MKTTKIPRVGLWVLIPLAALFIFAHFVHWFQTRYEPPHSITTVADVLEWTGRPWWVVQYTSPTATYYEVGKRVPVWTLGLTLASAAPSYTVDESGRFIGWSPDSGDVHTPDVLKSRDLKRESIDVDMFIRKSTQMTPNQALEATSEPARSAVSSSPQG